MKRRSIDGTLYLTTALCLLPMAMAALLYARLPEQVPTHWNFAGEIDGYSSRAFAGFGMPLLLAALNAVLHVAMNSDPKRGNVARPVALLAKWTVPAVCVLLVPMSLLAGLGREVPVGTLVPALVGLLVMAMGNYMPKTRSSYTVGIRLPWTLDSAENWRRTHRVAGVCFVLGGFLMLLTALAFPAHAWMGLFALLVLALVPCVYSFLLYRRGV